MKKYKFIITVFILVSARFSMAMSVNVPDTLKGYKFRVAYSRGEEQRATYIANLVAGAVSYYQKMLGSAPEFELTIWNEADWNIYVTNSAVYGMPHYKEKEKTLIVAATDNPFWKSYVPLFNQLPSNEHDEATKVYKTADGSLSMQAFFDLLAIHELGHAFQWHAQIKMQRKWMSELYVNILLHSYIAKKDPALLPALTIFPNMVVAGGTKGFAYTSLNDADKHYNELGAKYPRNYGWYQCRWHATAATIYEKSGSRAAKRLWNAFKDQNERLNDEELMTLLTATDINVADMVKNWDANTVR